MARRCTPLYIVAIIATISDIDLLFGYLMTRRDSEVWSMVERHPIRGVRHRTYNMYMNRRGNEGSCMAGPAGRSSGYESR